MQQPLRLLAISALFETEEPIANLFLACIHAFGIERASFGIDGTAPLVL